MVIGSAADSTQANEISNNGDDGLTLTGPATGSGLTIGYNQIASNTNDGIDMDVRPNNLTNILYNNITLNGGDGIEFTNSGASGTFNLNVIGNTIDFNDGRGFDVLARPGSSGSSTYNITFNDNVVNANDLEGVYVVYTASNNQTQDGSASDTLLSDGNVFHDVYLRFDSDNNQILANGVNSTFGTTRLVVRVGTTNAKTSTSNPGGFASNGAGSFTDSGVIMSVTNSTLNGNFGSDASSSHLSQHKLR